MKKVLCILEGYHGLTEANAICLSNIAKYWVKEGFLFDVLSIEKERSPEKDGVIQCVIPAELINNKFVRITRKFINMPVGRPFLVKLILDIFDELMPTEKYDGLLAIVNPVESAVAAVEIKKRHPSIYTVLYEIDPSSNRYKNPSNLFEKWWNIRSTRWEIETYRHFDRIIHMETHKKHFSSQKYKEFTSKTIYLDIPSYVPQMPEINEEGRDEIKLLYAGAFYPKLRNPKGMIEILKRVKEKIKIKTVIYTGNQMYEEVKAMTEDDRSFELNHYASQEVLRQEINDSDILLDLGNMDSDYLPSKTIQYMSEGKPIIHFCPDDQDVTVSYLNKYPLSLIVREKDPYAETVEQILEFIKVIKMHPVCDPYKLISVFIENTPEYSGRVLMEQFESC
jgi:hypothetical protein